MSRKRSDPPLAALGEWGFLNRLLPRLGRLGRGRFLVGPGDDAAVTPDRAVLTIDGLTDGTHFRSAWSSRLPRLAGLPLGEALAWKLLGSAASDLAAMGATDRRWAMIYLGAPKNLRLSFLEDLHRGTVAAARRFGLALAGGDTVRAEQLTLVAAVGARLISRRPLTRTGARPGDLLCVAGTNGDAGAGLTVLEGRGGRLSAEERRYFARRFFQPEPLFSAGARLAAEAGVTACLDVSDALSDCVDILCRASKVGAEIDIERIPVSARFARRLTKLDALAAGEDYNLLFSARPAAARRLEKSLGATVIGRVTKARRVDYRIHGLAVKSPRAFGHFS